MDSSKNLQRFKVKAVSYLRKEAKEWKQALSDYRNKQPETEDNSKRIGFRF